MRLKFLFFPLMLLICIFVFVMYILPEVNKLKETNKAKVNAQEVLNNIKEKKEAVNSLSQEINSTEAYKDVVYNYLPNRKVEEQIIAGINYLAADAQVNLVDISIEDAVSEKAGAVVPVSETGEAVDAAQDKGMLFSETTVEVLGDYEKIQIFLDQLQRMALINNLKSLNISKQVATLGGSSGMNIPGSSGESEAAEPTNLLVEIVMDFGYLEQIKVNANKLAKFETTLNGSVVEILGNYTSRKMVSVLPSPNGVAEGKINPFFP